MENPKTNFRPAVGGGVWAGSSGESYVIFASDCADYYVQTLLKTYAIGYKPLLGSYVMESTGEKIQENSYIINSRDLETIGGLGLIDTQESLLLLSQGDFHAQGKRIATLQFMDNVEHKQELGYFVPVKEEEALSCDYWTKDLTTGQYFITKGN